MAGVTLALPLAAQDAIARTVEHAGNRTVRLAFRARPGVCGNGSGNSFSTGRNEWRGKKGEWESECAPGPVRVAMDVSNGAPTSIRFYVGGRWGSLGDATDAGTVGAAEAARYFGALAEKATTRVAKEAIVVATLADSADLTPVLLRVAKDEGRDREVRKNAVFWLGQAVGDAVAPLDQLANDNDEDIEVRKQAVFALSQRPKDEAVPALIRIARGKGDARVRKQAIFWLGQSGDPRAVQYFEDVLAKH
jgi:hypothetical protein